MRHPRAGTGTGWYRNGGYYYRGRPGYPYYRYPRYYYGGYWGYPYYGPGWGAYGYYGWPWGGVSVTYDSEPAPGGGAVRLIVEPIEAEVYLDGRFVGVVDDFDGAFQRLRLAPGRHEIRLVLPGHHTQVFRVGVQAGQTLKIRYAMEAGEGEAAIQELPGYDEAAPPPQPQRAEITRPAPASPQQEQKPGAPPAVTSGWDDGAPPAWVAAIPRGAAIVRLDVTPVDASVYVDGAFHGLARDLEALTLSPGRHVVEVVRPGHGVFKEEVEVRAGEERSVEVRLPPSI